MRYFGGHTLLQILVKKPTVQEVERFTRGQVHVGLYLRGDTFFFLFKIESFYAWSDQAFSINLLPAHDREIPDVPEGARQPLTIVLVDADTGLVLAIRMVTFSAHTTQLLFRFLRRQLAALDNRQHELNVQAAYRDFPNSKDMARAAIVTERAGAKQPGDR